MEKKVMGMRYGKHPIERTLCVLLLLAEEVFFYQGWTYKFIGWLPKSMGGALGEEDCFPRAKQDVATANSEATSDGKCQIREHQAGPTKKADAYPVLDSNLSSFCFVNQLDRVSSSCKPDKWNVSTALDTILALSIRVNSHDCVHPTLLHCILPSIHPT
jgi:hypothetical protein